MSLDDRAVLVLEHNDGTTGEFHMMAADFREQLEREFLLGGRGQAIRELAEVLLDVDGTEGQSGAFLDAGQGTDTITLTWDGGHERENYNGVDVQWGDGSPGVDRWDATGESPQTQADVLLWWARNSRTDSFRSEAQLHVGEWTDGSFSDEAGIFGGPVSVVISNITVERDDNSPSSFEGTVELMRTSTFEDFSDENDPSVAFPGF